MKKYLILTLLGSVSFSLQSMIPPNFSAMPLDMKKEITSRLLDQDKILDVFKSLDSLRRVDKAFYKTLSSYEKLKPFFDLINADTLWQAFDTIENNSTFFKKYDLGRFLHEKFKYLTKHLTDEQYNAITSLLVDRVKMSQALNEVRSLMATKNKTLDELLFKAIEKYDMKSFITYIILGADINRLFDQYAFGATPLMFAAYYGNIPMVELLVEKGADVNKTNKRGWSVYYWARNKPEIEKLLVK